jgi:peptide alpha-N-acetyltransferase
MSAAEVLETPGEVVHQLLSTEGGVITISNYAGEAQLPGIMDMMTRMLSEPYSVYTYRHFVEGWPSYALVAHDAGGALVGAIVGKSELRLKDGRTRGYIAMLAVEKHVRGGGLGRTLASLVLARFASTCDEVVLEAEWDNGGALRLYEGLGFVRDKRMPMYYLNGNDAYRLKLWFS